MNGCRTKQFFEPPGLRARVRIQQRDPADAIGVFQRHVVRVRKAGVAPEHHHLDVREAGSGCSDRPVGAAVVHHDGPRHCNGLAFQRGEAIQQRLARIPVDDDDRSRPVAPACGRLPRVSGFRRA